MIREDIITEEEFEEIAEDDEEGVLVLVKIVEGELGVSLMVAKDEPNGEYFMNFLDTIYRTSAFEAIELLIRTCEKHERGVLAKEIRAFLESPQVLH
jgi:hypothetical protein